MTQPILVTGATGTIGTQVVNALRARGANIRAAARGGSVELALGDTASVDRALDGVAAAFLLTPFAEDQVALGTHFIDRAKAAGVKRIVKLSAIGADSEPGIQLGRWHRAIEKHLESSGLEYTLLRPNNYMQNFITYYPPDASGTIYLPWGTGAASFIDAVDVGRVAAVALTEAGHAGKAYTLTGPAAISIADAAATLTKVAGRPISYVDVPESAARKGMLDAGVPAWMADAMLELHAIDKAGYATVVTDDVAKITGTPARSFAAFADANAKAWRQ